MDNMDVIKKIAYFLLVSVNQIRGDIKHPQYRVRTSTVSSHTILVNYLVKYPLFGSKFIDFNSWCHVFYYFQKAIHKDNASAILEIKSQMNDRRTIFN